MNWISVKDQLPEDGKIVLWYVRSYKTHLFFVGKVIKKEDKFDDIDLIDKQFYCEDESCGLDYFYRVDNGLRDRLDYLFWVDFNLPGSDGWMQWKSIEDEKPQYARESAWSDGINVWAGCWHGDKDFTAYPEELILFCWNCEPSNEKYKYWMNLKYLPELPKENT